MEDRIEIKIETSNDQSQNVSRMMQIIWAALSASMLIYFVVAWAIVTKDSAPVALSADFFLGPITSPLDSVFGLMGISSLIFSLIIPRVIFNKTRILSEIRRLVQGSKFGGDTNLALPAVLKLVFGRYFVATIIKMAIIETIAVFGFICVMFSHRFNVVSTGLLVIGFLVQLGAKPRTEQLRSEVVNWLQRSEIKSS